MRHSVLALAALSLWQGCTAQGTIETLVPYHPSTFDISKRDAPPTITLQDELSLIWGSSNGSTFVNVTLNTGETELVISTEHFADSLTDVQCTNDLVLTFKDNATFQDAIADWSWVNFHENRTFFLINNWGPCAAASESGRQPWVVHGVDVYDEQNFIVNFNATLSEWDDVMSNSVIEFGSMPSTSTKRDDTVSKTLSLSLAHSLPQTFFSKSTNSGLDFSIDCPGCATTGSINVVGKIVMGTVIGIPTSVKSVSITATPQGVGANLALGFGVSGTLGSGWSKEWNLVTVGLPGWSIPKIITLGPQFSVDAGFALSGIEGSAQISAGINVAIPDSSSAVLGITGVDSSFKGWVPTVTPQTPKVSVEVDGHLELFTEIGLDVGLTVLSKWGFGGGLFLRVPDVNINLGAEFNTQGVCPGSADVFGVKLGATVGVDLGLGVYTESSGTKNWKTNTTIYQNNNLITPVDKCFPLGPSLPSTIKSVSIKTVGTVPASSKASTTSAKPTTSAVSSLASTTRISATSNASGSASASSVRVSGTTQSTSRASGSASASSIRVSGTTQSTSRASGSASASSIRVSGTTQSTSRASGGTSASSVRVSGTSVLSSIRVSGTGVSSSIRVSNTGVSSSIRVSGTGVSSSIRVSGTGVSSSARVSGTGISSSIRLSGTAQSTSRISSTGVSSSIRVSGTGVSSSKIASTSASGSSTGRISGTGVSSSSKVSGTGVSSSSIRGSGSATASSSTVKISATSVSSTILGYGPAPVHSSTILGYGPAPVHSSTILGYGPAPIPSSTILGYGPAPVPSSTTKLSGTGVSSSSRVGSTGVISSSSITRSSGTVVTSSSRSISASGVSSVRTSIASSRTSSVVVSSSRSISASGVSSVRTSIASSGTSSVVVPVTSKSSSTVVVSSSRSISSSGVSSVRTSIASSRTSSVVISSSRSISASGVSSVRTSIASSRTSSAVGLDTSKSSSSAKPTTTAGGPVSGSPTSSALSLVTSKASSSTKLSSTAVVSATSTKASSTASSTVIPTKSATGTIAPAPTATGTISTCDKWVTIEDTTCSCTNIEDFYGVTAANLHAWNPALGSECKLTVGQAVCIGVKGSYYKRAVNGRLARFVDA